MRKLCLGVVLCGCTMFIGLSGSSHADITIVSDNFEDASGFSSDWDSLGFDASSSATIGTNGPGSGAEGTDNFAVVSSEPAGIGARAAFGAEIDGTPANVYVDFYAQVQDVSGFADPAEVRQLNFQFGGDVQFFENNPTVNSNSAQLNLRFQDGGWAAFSDGWQPIAGVTPLTAGNWHRVRVTANDWGTANANYDLAVSDAGSTTLNVGATGLSDFPNDANPALGPFVNDATTVGLGSFNFNARFGNNPGFNVDQVQAVIVVAVPEPSSAALLALGTLGLVARRKRS